MDRQARREELQLIPLEELRAMVPHKLNGYEPTGLQDLTISILQALSAFAPSEVGQRNINADILACATNHDLFQLAERYRIGLLLPMRAAGGRTPPVSHHPSRLSANLDGIVSSGMLQPINCDRQTMRELALHRENYRCIVTGKCDLESLQAGKIIAQEDDDVTIIAAAHILPFALAPRSDDPLSFQRSGMVWQTIAAFSGIFPDELSGHKINCAENSISLDSAMHLVFRELSLCFESTSDINTYQVRRFGALQELKLLKLPDTISFVSRSGVPVPDPRYLSLHASCAKVLHTTGIAGALDKLIEDLGRTPELSNDGSSAHFLRHALEMIVPE